MLKQWTTTIIALTIIFLVTWDVLAILYSSNESSISSIMYDFSRKHPIIPLAVGVLIGHFFWPVILEVTK